MNRSTFIKFALCSSIGAFLGAALPAHAQEYPARPVKIVVPFSPGGAVDILARMLSQRMAPRLGRSVIVENKVGAAGNIGVGQVARADADGYTLTLALSSNLMINQFLYSNLPYNPGKDFALIAKVADAPLLLVVNESVPVNTPQELKQYITDNKDKLTYGSWGNGTISHLSGARVDEIASGAMTHVPYKGEAPMIQELVAGRLSMSFATGAQAPQFIAAGKLKAIGVTGTQPIPSMPNVPPLASSGFDDSLLRSVGWVALAAPAGTPKAIVDRLASEVKHAMQQPELRQHIEGLGWVPSFAGPEALADMYKNEAPMWQDVIERSGVKLD